jgi:predicted transcriptional regulator
MPPSQTEETLERVWMVERTFAADSPHILVIIYATPDGSRYLQKERAFNRFGGRAPDITAAIEADADELVAVKDTDRRERYAAEAARMRDRHDPDDTV